MGKLNVLPAAIIDRQRSVNGRTQGVCRSCGFRWVEPKHRLDHAFRAQPNSHSPPCVYRPYCGCFGHACDKFGNYRRAWLQQNLSFSPDPHGQRS